MAPTEILLSFAVATAIFAYLPGPALLYTAAPDWWNGFSAMPAGR